MTCIPPPTLGTYAVEGQLIPASFSDLHMCRGMWTHLLSQIINVLMISKKQVTSQRHKDRTRGGSLRERFVKYEILYQLKTIVRPWFHRQIFLEQFMNNNERRIWCGSQLKTTLMEVHMTGKTKLLPSMVS